MHTHATWKDADLIARAAAVSATSADTARISARAAARCLWGVVMLVCRQWSRDEMQMACARLVRDVDAWESRLARLPVELDGRVHPALEHMAIVARGILPICDVDTMRAALAFWATECDPVEWQKVAAGVAA